MKRNELKNNIKMNGDTEQYWVWRPDPGCPGSKQPGFAHCYLDTAVIIMIRVYAYAPGNTCMLKVEYTNHSEGSESRAFRM